MRLCVPVPCFFGHDDFCDAIRRIGALGYDAAETYDWEGLDLPRVRRTCEESGVELLSMCTTEFRLTDPSFRAAWLAGAEKSCAAAVQVGARRLITQVGPDTGAPREYQHAAIVETLCRAVPTLAAHGVTMMIEPLNTYVNHPGYYLTSSAEAFAIVREVNSPFVKVVFDIYHQQIMEGNILPNITHNLDAIAHLHAAGHPGRHEMWMGENDYRFIFDAVDRAGYTGACGLEYQPFLDPTESLRQAKARYGS